MLKLIIITGVAWLVATVRIAHSTLPAEYTAISALLGIVAMLTLHIVALHAQKEETTS